jgi:hypothetical protein
MGRPWQRRRARRLAKRGKIRCALFGASNPGVLPTRALDGAAEVWEGRIRLWDADLWVQDVEFPPEPGAFVKLDEKGRHWPADERLLFCPPTLVYTLRTHRGRVKWAVLDWQADTALAMLGFPTTTPTLTD